MRCSLNRVYGNKRGVGRGEQRPFEVSRKVGMRVAGQADEAVRDL